MAMTEHTVKEPLVTLTRSAVERLKEMLRDDPSNDGKCLRLSVESGGCSGQQYGMEFTLPKDGDLSVEFDDMKIVVEPGSAELLRGSEVNFEDSLTQVGFTIRNPQAKQSCGCGKSFEA